MKLLIPNTQNADAVLQLRWCLTSKDRRDIVGNKVEEPHILIVVARKQKDRRYVKPEKGKAEKVVYNYTEVSRHLTPLTDAAVYQVFEAPGEYVIFACIVGDADTEVEWLRKRYLGADRQQLVTETGDFTPKWPFSSQTQVEVVVGPEFFAPPPPAWEKSYFEFWPLFQRRAVDQCSWRRRRMFAYSFMPVFLLVWWAVAVAAGLVAYLVGFTQGRYNMNFQAVWRIYTYDFRAIWRNTHFTNAWFFEDRGGKEHLHRLLIHPWLLGALMIIARITFGRWATWREFLLRFVFLYGIVLVIVGLCFVGYLVHLVYRKYFPLPDEAKLKAEQARLARTKLQALEAELSALSCGLVDENTPIPIFKFRLRYQQLKAQYCKPFSKG